MIATASLIPLAFLVGQVAAMEPIIWLDQSRVKVSAEIRNPDSPIDHANAQMRLMQLAKKACRKIGKPVSEGTLELDDNGAEGKARRLVLSEVYVCVAD